MPDAQETKVPKNPRERVLVCKEAVPPEVKQNTADQPTLSGVTHMAATTEVGRKAGEGTGSQGWLRREGGAGRSAASLTEVTQGVLHGGPRMA